ncbi:hypothetical protein FPV25_03035 [Carnobacterium sp. PL17GRE32]|uniref:hypothetical protein n=1 Tax=Carnobacterium sp. PL17GRE32 TaxID=2592355 RepID=UPI0011ED39B8|nr:hypothetical protein [Carnobacterium sp. PL17GRE32]KAF3306005.1 hypothetical protein FPV25_03035 [Carnobacterium sp. PL17GRE32]
MNYASKKFLYWSFVTVAYLIGWVSAIEFNFNGYITTLLFWAMVGNAYKAYQYAKTADLFVGFEEETE